MEELRSKCGESNAKLLSELREDPNADALWRSAQEDAEMGRMTPPVPIDEADCSGLLLSPRCRQLGCAGSLGVGALGSCVPGLGSSKPNQMEGSKCDQLTIFHGA